MGTVLKVIVLYSANALVFIFKKEFSRQQDFVCRAQFECIFLKVSNFSLKYPKCLFFLANPGLVHAML